MAPHAPPPSHIVRVHTSQISVVSFSTDNERLYSGDLSGTVVITSTRTLRSISAWAAHTDGLLGVEEWQSQIITHGRDNKMHIWDRVLTAPGVGDAASRPDLPRPALKYSLDVNALNFCSFSLLALPIGPIAQSSSQPNDLALVAIPNLVESSLADVWELPSCRRLHAAIGKLEAPETGIMGWQPDGRSEANKSGILMSLHLFLKSLAGCTEDLHLLSTYESGEVALRRYTSVDREMSVEGRGWQLLWVTKQHAESVMASAISLDYSFALSVSADHLVVRYNLFDAHTRTSSPRTSRESELEVVLPDTQTQFKKFRIKQVGNSAIALHSNGRVCAIGGWDGRIRLFSTKSFKPLGTLEYHTKGCKALRFAHSTSAQGSHSVDSEPFITREGLEEDDADEDLTQKDIESRSRWLAAGAQDNRLSIWELIDFNKKREQ